MVIGEQHIFGLNVTVVNAGAVRVVECVQQLRDEEGDLVLGQGSSSAADQLVHVHLAQLAHETE